MNRDRAGELVRGFLGSLEVPGDLATLLTAAADRLDAYLGSEARWQALALPLETADACGGADPDRLDAVVGAILLLFLAADLLDDAADGDLHVEPWRGAGWPRVANAGVMHIFLALHAAHSAGGDLAQGLSAEIADAGYRMAIGQHLDLSHGGSEPPTREAYLAAIARKTGGSFRMQCRMGALAADGASDTVEALGKYGLALGSAMQLAGDLREILWRPDASDLRNGRWTLPTLALWEAGWRGDLRSLANLAPAALEALLKGHGAIAACEAEFGMLMAEARQALGTASLPPGSVEPLAVRTRVALLPQQVDELSI